MRLKGTSTTSMLNHILLLEEHDYSTDTGAGNQISRALPCGQVPKIPIGLEGMCVTAVPHEYAGWGERTRSNLVWTINITRRGYVFSRAYCQNKHPLVC